MPKILSKPKRKILMAAVELSEQKKDANLEMREIAQKADVSVGSIYNYYDNKIELYKDIFLLKWYFFDLKINSKIKIEDTNYVKFKKYMESLYYFVVKNEAIVFNVRKMCLSAKCEDVFKEKYEKLFMEILKDKNYIDGNAKFRGFEKRIIKTSLDIIINTINAFPGEHEKNIKYLNKIADVIYEKSQ